MQCQKFIEKHFHNQNRRTSQKKSLKSEEGGGGNGRVIDKVIFTSAKLNLNVEALFKHMLQHVVKETESSNLKKHEDAFYKVHG